jgi:hypothetical protein
MAQEVAGHLGNHSGAKTYNCFGQQALDISTRVLDFVKSAFDPLPDATQPPIQALSVLKILIGTPRSPNQIVGLIKDLSLPFQANETLISEDITANQVIYDSFSRQTLVQISWNQIIHNWNTAQSGNGDQFVTEVIHIAASAFAVVGTPSKIAVSFVAFVAHYGNGFGIQKILAVQMPAFLLDPIPA